MATISDQAPDESARRTQQTIYPPEEREQRRTGETPREEKTTIGILTGGSSLELIGGGAAVVLAIIGLAGNWPLYMSAISTIAIGAGLLAYGGAIAARWNETVRRYRLNERETASGIGTEIVGGAAGVVIGILALAGVMPTVLLPVAAIVLGASLLLGAAAQPQLAVFSPDRDARFDQAERQSLKASSGVMVLVGVGAVVLGVLALIGVGPAMTMSMVAMLGIGCALVIAGGVSTTKFAHRLQQVS
jgi:hypothetical protein